MRVLTAKALPILAVFLQHRTPKILPILAVSARITASTGSSPILGVRVVSAAQNPEILRVLAVRAMSNQDMLAESSLISGVL